MYKSGKMWLFASASLLLLNTQLLTAHADEPTSASTGATSVVVTNGVLIQNQGSSNQTLASSVSKTITLSWLMMRTLRLLIRR
ncbi:KxYKxGKxW signal peptide domain-containing protein [Lactiplantibacillus plantarum]|uniref:KxYKxGKxW signal peptide domain-containing protein n=1 Tax=Lactiplantibacillus plantarum TaxID=1590 RepID=UPI0021CB9459|nr:KxYKxGKxW signal peptide domain-containing protein [Lactiplantibacillus plantarum]